MFTIGNFPLCAPTCVGIFRYCHFLQSPASLILLQLIAVARILMDVVVTIEANNDRQLTFSVCVCVGCCCILLVIACLLNLFTTVCLLARSLTGVNSLLRKTGQQLWISWSMLSRHWSYAQWLPVAEYLLHQVIAICALQGVCSI